MKVIKSFIIILVFYSSCTLSNNKPVFDENMIKLISENPIYSGNQNIPPNYVSTTFFVQGKHGKILLLDPRELEEIFINDYSSWKYDKFVRKALNQELIIKNENIGKPFELDKEVMSNYLKHDFLDFLKMYSEKIELNDRYMLKNDIQKQQLFSVLFYSFINNYLSVFDDYIGCYFVIKTSIYTKKNL